MAETMGSPRLIINHVRGHANRFLFDEHARDNCCEPYLKLRGRFAELGYSFVASEGQRLEDCAWIFVWDAWSIPLGGPIKRAIFDLKARHSGRSRRDLVAEATRLGIQDRLVLLMFEPPTVCPENFDPQVQSKFEAIFTWDPRLVDGCKFHRIYLPGPTEFPRLRNVPFSQKKLLVDISSYNSLSHPRELNTERRAAARYFQSRFPDNFDIFGAGWNLPPIAFAKRWLANPGLPYERFPAYRGIAGSKIEVYPHYKFAMCYENIRDEPGYVSLKIMDCLRCGVVPIYWGAPDIQDYVDSAAFVDRRQFKSNEELGRYLSCVSEKQHGAYLDAARAYMAGAKSKSFLSEHFVDSILHGLGLTEAKAV